MTEPADDLGWDVELHGRMVDASDDYEPSTSRWRNMLDQEGDDAVPDPPS